MKNASPNPPSVSSTGLANPGGGSFGATPGGVQDMGLARDLVSQGMVPPPEAFVVEGMLSEHDLPIDGPPCQDPLCLRAVMGVAPDSEGMTSAWVQIGFSSSVDPDTFDRPALTLVVALDVSGSMGASYADKPTPLEISKTLLREIVGELNASDRFALVTYGSDVHTVVELAPVVSSSELLLIIDSLHHGGSTYMEAGLDAAFAIATGAVGQTGEVRVLLLTDVRPNVGTTEPSAFQTQAENAATHGVGLTVFGTGLGLDNTLMTAISGLRGGNAFSLMDTEDVDRMMTDQWPWMFCPIAYELSLTLSPTGLSLRRAYGFPPGPDGEAPTQLQVKTIFLSRNKGATLVQLEPDATHTTLVGTGVALQFAYQTTTGAPVTTSDGCSYEGQPLDPNGQYLPQTGIARAVALAVLVTTLGRAAAIYAAAPGQAIDIARGALTRITADAAALGDASLDVEVAFTASLLTLMENGAPQSTFYPGG
jgi:Ca-activated chloride channel family protein